jgi:hypothetical protein
MIFYLFLILQGGTLRNLLLHRICLEFGGKNFFLQMENQAENLEAMMC